MSIKRQATTDLNHDNWDQEEPSDQEEKGQFQAASKAILEKRVFRTAKRRNPVANEPNKSVFSGFGGFNKTPQSSFDFLANLTNENKNTNGSAGKSSNSENSVTSSLSTTTSSGGLFGASTLTTLSKPPLSTTLTSTSSRFGAMVKTSPSDMFTPTKADSTVNESPFKMQPVSSSADTKSTKLTASSTLPTATNVFGVSSTSANDSKPLFSSTTSSPFTINQTMSNTTTTLRQASSSISTVPTLVTTVPESTSDNTKKMRYYSQLSALNESVAAWITKHVSQTPLCVLTPIFVDYNKYVKEITEEYNGGGKGESGQKTEAKTETKTEARTDNVPVTITPSTPFGNNNKGATPSDSPSNATSKPSIFGAQSNLTSPADSKPPQPFSFGIKPSANNASTTTTTATGFSLGVTTSSLASTTSPLLMTTNAPTNQTTSAPFSFGVGKPFSFSSNNVQKSSPEPAATGNDEDEPPKMEYTPMKEDNCVYEKKCKVFVKKDGSFADKGVGTLYVKKIEESGKHQLLVRANNSLGSVLLNLVLASAIPTQRMGKSNVMLVCIPTPDAKPPPTTVLIRVKTGEEADEVLKTLNKYKA